MAEQLNELNHISPLPPRVASMDFAQLLSAGIAHCQRLGSQQWTDYNEHDPGVTILEQLCYAITDIGYRIDFPVPDILAEQPQLNDPGNNPLYTGDQILTCNPLTVADFRKLLIDTALTGKYANFKNVWLRPLPHPAAGPAGVYQMQVELYEPQQDNSDLLEVLKSAFLANRNLNEDLDPTVQLLQPVDVAPTATVEVNAGADPNAVLADILFQVQDALVPFVRIQNIDQLLQAGVEPDRIYAGPLLQSGAIADDCLQPKMSAVVQSDIGNAILRAAGVRNITRMGLTVGGVPVPPDGAADIGDMQIARLAPSIFGQNAGIGSGFSLMRQGVALSVDAVQVGKLLARMLADVTGSENYAPDKTPARSYTRLPQGQYRDIARYYSIQRQFPLTYGIGEYGVKIGQPQTAGDVKAATARQAQARQLKAFLLFFEQVLCDCQQQLAAAPRLLSLETDLDRSYFWQSLAKQGDGPPSAVELLRPGSTPPVPPAPPADGNRYTVYILDRDAESTALLRSRECDSQVAAEYAKGLILRMGAEFINYTLRDLPGSQFQLLLDDGLAAFGCQRFAERGKAEAGAVHAAMLIDELTRDERLRERCVRIEVTGKYTLRLLGDDGAILFRAGRLTADGWEARRQRMLGCGLSSASYIIEETGRGHWRLRMMDIQRGQLLAEGEQRFALWDDADAAVHSAIALFQRMCRDPSSQASHFIAEPPLPPAPVPTPDPDPDADPRVRAYLAGLNRLVRDFDPYPARRNRFLNHLLARFCEQFDDETLRQLDPRPASVKDLFDRDLIAWKNRFLRNYTPTPPREHAPQERAEWLGGARSRGIDQSVDLFDSSNRTGLALRLRLLLGMPPHATPAARWRTAVGSDASGVLAQMDKPDSAYVFSAGDPAIFQRLMRYGADASRYRIAPADADGGDGEGPSTVLFRWPDTDKDEEILKTAGPDAARGAIANLTSWLHDAPRNPEVVYGGERMHVLEHILLRTDTAQSGPDILQQDPDFYAYKVSIFFPAESIRFQSPLFRAFAQHTAEENCPAHIDVTCYWLPPKAMEVFLNLYTNWAKLYRESPTAGPKEAAARALANFIHDDAAAYSGAASGAHP